MKREIIGYITGISNVYARNIKETIEDGIRKDDARIIIIESTLKDLDGLIDFIIDIPTVKQEVAATNVEDTEVILLRNKVRELENVCRNLKAIEEGLYYQITKLENNCEDYIIEEKSMKEQISEFRKYNKQWEAACNTLKKRNEFLEKYFKQCVQLDEAVSEVSQG